MSATAPAEDRTLPHQMRIVAEYTRNLLAVSCNCMQDGDGRFIPLTEPAHTLDPKKGLAAYAAHLAAWTAPLTVPERRALALSLTRAYHAFRVAAQVRLRQDRDTERASLALSLTRAYHAFRVAAQVRLRQDRDTERASLALAAADCAALGRDVAAAEVPS